MRARRPSAYGGVNRRGGCPRRRGEEGRVASGDDMCTRSLSASSVLRVLQTTTALFAACERVRAISRTRVENQSQQAGILSLESHSTPLPREAHLLAKSPVEPLR